MECFMLFTANLAVKEGPTALSFLRVGLLFVSLAEILFLVTAIPVGGKRLHTLPSVQVVIPCNYVAG